MAVVSDVPWVCPGCGSLQTAQILGYYGDGEVSPHAIPTECGGLRHHPPCENCGRFRLMPAQTFACVPQPVERTEE